MQITIKIESGKVRKGLRNIAEAIPGIAFRRMWRMFKSAKERLQRYPPERPNQTYIRTGRYGRSFEVIKLGAGVIGARLESDAVQRGRHYTKYVGGDAVGSGQARVHAGRWPLIADVLNEEVTRNVAAEIDAELSDVIRQEGMGL